MNWAPGKKYVRRGGDYYLYHGRTEDGKLLVERRGGIYKLYEARGVAVLYLDNDNNDMLPEVYHQPIKYSKVVYLAKPLCPAHEGLDLVRYLFGQQNIMWSEKQYEEYTIPVRVTVETIVESEELQT